MRNYIRKLAWTNVLKKKKRTTLSLISVLLSTAIIYTALVLFINVTTFSKEADYSKLGNFHYAFVSEEPKDFAGRYTYSLEMDLGIQENNISLNSIEIKHDIVPFYMIEGRYPNNNKEILVDDISRLNIGDEIPIDNRNFKVVGIYQKTDIHNQIHSNKNIYYTAGLSSKEIIYYVKDEYIEAKNMVVDFAEAMDINENEIIVNTNLISHEVIKVYMQNTSVILLSFILITLLSIGTSLISIHNVILISDDSRKKELGLLKSIGLRPNMVKYLIQVELLILGTIGSMIGIGIGIATSSVILKLFIHRFYIEFSYLMILKPLWMIVSLAMGIGMMYISGMSAYKKYIYTLAVDDLKEVPYAYEKPQVEQNESKREISWDLFLIYNRRMKQQTTNIRHSFLLLLIATIMFMSVTLSNIVYKNAYTGANGYYDFYIHRVFDLEDMYGTDINIPFVDKLHEIVSESDVIIEKLIVDRFSNESIITQLYMYRDPVTKELNSFIDELDRLGRSYYVTNHGNWTDININTMWLDQYQQDILEPYIVAGSFDDLIEYYQIPGKKNSYQYDNYVAVYVDKGEETLWKNIKINDYVSTYPIDRSGFGTFVYNNNPINEQELKKIAVIIEIPEEKAEMVYENLGISLAENTYFMARGYQTMYQDPTSDAFWVCWPYLTDDSIEEPNPKEACDPKSFRHNGIETYSLRLKNNSLHMQFQKKLEKIILETDAKDRFEFTNYPLMRETYSFSTFIVDVLLYPLFFMLFIASLLNIYNVLIGNLQLKRGDISIMKSIGMKNKVLRKMLLFEYLEGYINASVIAFIIFITGSIALSILSLDLVIDWQNTLASLIFAVLTLSPILILPILIICLRRIKDVLPIENASQME